MWLRNGISVMNRPTHVENKIPNIIVKLRALPKNGLWLKNETYRVRDESKLKNCIMHRET
jgi:hypothetical protein